MAVAVLTLELAIEHAQSLKDRRQVVRSLKDRLRHGVQRVRSPRWMSHWSGTVRRLELFAVNRSRDYLAGQMAEVEQTAERLLVGLGASILESSLDMLDD